MIDIDKVHGDLMKPVTIPEDATAAARHLVEVLARLQSALREVTAARQAADAILEHQTLARSLAQRLTDIGVDLTELVIRCRLHGLTELQLDPAHVECGTCVEAHGERRGAR